MTTYPKAALEKQAEEILESNDAMRAPVPLESIVHNLGLKLQAKPLADGLSGVLLIEGGQGVIGYNALHHPVRQRFTIAHEIGHFQLHVHEASQLFIDKTITFHRNYGSSSGSDRMEVEANGFAAALLMPKKLVLEEIQKGDVDLDDEDDIAALAKRFGVSTAAMSFRLVNLGLVRFDAP